MVPRAGNSRRWRASSRSGHLVVSMLQMARRSSWHKGPSPCGPIKLSERRELLLRLLLTCQVGFVGPCNLHPCSDPGRKWHVLSALTASVPKALHKDLA